MSKRYKNKDCPYCGVKNVTSTADNVFAREFFLKESRENLPIVPACADCNQCKSVLEHYTVTVLPFGARHSAARDAMIPVGRRLEANQKLQREIADIRREFVLENRIDQPSMAIPVEASKILNWLRFVAQGLHFYHYKEIPQDRKNIGIGIWPASYDILFCQGLSKVNFNSFGLLGGDIFEYYGSKFSDVPRSSLWRIKILGGILLAGENIQQSVSSNYIWMIISPNKDYELFYYHEQ
jgi:hypothetical protein